MEIRLYNADNITSGDVIKLDKAQGHYLLHVLRCKAGAEVLLFNGHSGEFKSVFNGSDQITIGEQTQHPVMENKLTLIFAPVKFGKIDMLVQKATELGVTKLQPVQTRYTVPQRINYDRMLINVIEAAEQSCRISIPEIVQSETLDKLLQHWDSRETLIFCDETGEGEPIAKAAKGILDKEKNTAVLIGPEGGFAKEEADLLRKQKFVTPVSMGKRIMRSETAAIAALAAIQAVGGDWVK